MDATTLDHYLKDGTVPPAGALSYGVRTVVERDSTLSVSGAGRLLQTTELNATEVGYRPHFTQPAAVHRKSSARSIVRTHKAGVSIAD